MRWKMARSLKFNQARWDLGQQSGSKVQKMEESMKVK